MTGKWKQPRRGRGRPPKEITEAREFGHLVEEQMASGMPQARAFEYVRRRDPKRWGSPRTHYRLWAAYYEDRPKQLQAMIQGQLRRLEELQRSETAEAGHDPFARRQIKRNCWQ